MPPIDVIDPGLLDETVAGGGLHADEHGRTSFRAQLDSTRPTLLLLLRHLGCLFCREMVKDVRIASDRADSGRSEKAYPRVVFIHTATPEQGARFFGRFWPGAPAISDPRARLYAGLGVVRGSPLQLFGPRACACGVRALLKGHWIGKPAGDPWMMPGALLVGGDGRVLHRHVFAHAGDHPSFEIFADQPARPAASSTLVTGAA